MRTITTRVINSRHTEVSGADVSHLVPMLIPRKIPKEMFLEFLKRADEWRLEYGNEIQWDLYLDLKTGDFEWDEPVQITSPIRVEPETNFEKQTGLFVDEKGEKRFRYKFLGSIHSHPTFKPFISQVDADSQAVFQLFGILGNFHKGEVLDESFINPKNLIFSTYHEDKHYIIPFDEVIEYA